MIWLILLLAFALRLINLNQSLWLDEAINVIYAKSSDFWWFVTKYPIGDFHPPGWFVILWAWSHVFGFSENAVRLPSMILGVATVGLTFLLGKELFNKKVGLLAAFLLAIAPLHIYYSQEARMYAFSAFAVTSSFYFLNRLIQNKRLAGFGFVISLILVLYSDYLAYLVIPSQIIYLLWIKGINRKILLGYFMAAVVLIPWLNIFPLQLQTGLNKAIGLPGWGQVVGGSNVKDLLMIPVKTFFGRAVMFDKTLYVVISALVGISYGFVFLYAFKKINRQLKLSLSWIVIPVALAFLISFFVPVLSYFRLIYILPAFYLILGKSLAELPKKVAIAVLIFIYLVSIASLVGYYLDPRFQREDWRQAVNFVSQNLDKNSLVIFENNEVPAPVKYYSSNLSSFKPGISTSLADNLAGKNKVYLFEYLVDVYDPSRMVVSKLKNLGFIETAAYDFTGVGFVRKYTRL
ncbi:MAG: glycosyltransferase family 39 protein [Actinobacteria bacterium]|nr:glycosyltransferase family 39 protein [Actinomycetota bacterium]